MQNLEAQLHTLLEEIAPEAHNYDETAKIIATASAIINKKYNSRKLTKTSSRQVEAFLTDALLQSMSVLETWEDDFSYGYVDGRGLSASQLINIFFEIFTRNAKICSRIIKFYIRQFFLPNF